MREPGRRWPCSWDKRFRVPSQRGAPLLPGGRREASTHHTVAKGHPCLREPGSVRQTAHRFGVRKGIVIWLLPCAPLTGCARGADTTHERGLKKRWLWTTGKASVWCMVVDSRGSWAHPCACGLPHHHPGFLPGPSAKRPNVGWDAQAAWLDGRRAHRRGEPKEYPGGWPHQRPTESLQCERLRVQQCTARPPITGNEGSSTITAEKG